MSDIFVNCFVNINLKSFKFCGKSFKVSNRIESNDSDDLRARDTLDVSQETDHIVLQRSTNLVNSGFVHKFQKQNIKQLVLLNFRRHIKNSKILSIIIFLMLICQNVELNPGPRDQSVDSFSVLTYNCNGLGQGFSTF